MMLYQKIDVLDMRQLASNQFDIVLDKGTTDALICGPNYRVDVAVMLNEVQRVLKPGGVYIVITFGKPDHRLLFFKYPFLSWTIKSVEIEREVFK